MNIFYLDHDPREAARMHCDQHVRKMMLEYAQILSTVIHLNAKSRRWIGDKLYKPTHVHHPVVLWTRSTLGHYDWLYLLWNNLHDEYIYRFGKKHKSFVDLNDLLSDAPFYYTSLSLDFTPPPQVMPSRYRQEFTTLAYREYYIHEKSRFAVWTKREPPEWFLRGIEKHENRLPHNIRAERNAPAS